MPVIRSLLALALFASGLLAADLQTLDGKTYSGEIVSLTDKEIVIKEATGTQKISVDNILQIELVKEAPAAIGARYIDVALNDGTLLHCSKFDLKGNEVTLKLATSEQTIKLPLTALTYVLNDAQDPANRQEWQEKVLAKRTSQDVLAFKINGAFNAFDGTLGEGNDKGAISFEYGPADNRKTRIVPPAKTFGLYFLRSPNPNAPAALCKVYDVNQNVLVAAKIALGDKTAAVTTVAGPVVDYPRASLVRLDFSNDKVAFLSDLRPIETITKSKQGRKENLRLDKNLENSTLQIAGKTFNKGLALHAHTELTYALDGKFAKFEAVLGMDDKVTGDGKPVVKIEADGKELLSTTVTRTDKVRELNLDVRGAKHLRIVVTSSGIFDFGDHVDLAKGKLSK